MLTANVRPAESRTIRQARAERDALRAAMRASDTMRLDAAARDRLSILTMRLAKLQSR